MTPPRPPDVAAKHAAPPAWLAQLQQELLAPAHALRERAAMLAEDVEPFGASSLTSDLVTVQTAAQRFENLLQMLGLEDPANDAAGLTRLRHDLRTPLHQIIGYCDLWLEDSEPGSTIERFRADIEGLREIGRELNARLDRMRFSDSASSAPADDADTAAVRRIVSEWTSTAPLHTRPPVAPGRILVVDDNEFNRDVLARRLVRQGHTVAQAVNGEQALEMLDDGEFDIVLLDVIMPQMNGLELLERLKSDERWRHIPVIMISALNDIDGVAHCLTMGADDYLPRPYNQVILKARIDALLERKRLRDREIEQRAQIEREKERADALLHVIMPPEVVGELQATGSVRPRRYERVAVLFADIVGFTPYCDAHAPEDVVAALRRLIERFEQIALECGVQKIKTIGDAFMAAAGLFRPTENPVLDCVRCGVELLRAAAESPPRWPLRVGIHCGSVMGGVVGSRQYLFDIWGDAVNTASRVEHAGEPGAVTLSTTAWEHVRECCEGQSRGAIEIKGKGPMELVQLGRFV